MIFQYKTKIYGYDCDIYGHLNNASYQHIYEAARSEMLTDLGLSLSSLLSENIHIYIRKIIVEYFHGIQFESEITVKSSIQLLSRVKSIWLQEMWSENEILMNRATVEGIFVKDGKPFRISSTMKEILQEGSLNITKTIK